MWYKIKQFFINIYNWLNDATNRYHDISHVLLAFFVTTVFNLISGTYWLGICFTMCYILIKEIFIDGFTKDSVYDVLHFVYGIVWSLVVLMIYNTFY